MADVLALVSKAIFEKQGGKQLKAGDVWATATYASKNPGLAGVAGGGSLFLVTVRPGERLWLVAILTSPRFDGQGWTASPNAAPTKDITDLLDQLKLKSGKGVHAEPGKLGMSLQTPRELTPEDGALLGGGRAAAARAPAPAPASAPPAVPPQAPVIDSLPDDNARLAQLPPACAAALREAMKQTQWTGARAHVEVALRAVGFPEGAVYALPSSLTPDQRRLAELFADHRGLPSNGFAMPPYQWSRKGWLQGGRRVDELMEVDEGGVTHPEPIWRAMQLANADGHLDDWTRRLPLLTLMDVFVELCAEQKGLLSEVMNRLPVVKRVVKELGDGAREWAPKAADRLLQIEAEPGRSIPLAAKFIVFLALVRGGVSIESRWDPLLPGDAGDLLDASVDCARAIPEVRRAKAIAHALDAVGGLARETVGFKLLDLFPSEELTRWVHGFAERSGAVRYAWLMENFIGGLANRHPIVKETLAKLNEGKPPPRVLRCQDLLVPEQADQLTPMQQKQLQVAGKLYDGRNLSAAERLSDRGLSDPEDPKSGGSFKGFIEVWVVCDEKGQELYDALLYMVDAGTVFKRGTTSHVAELVQGGVPAGKDPLLADALNVAFHQRKIRKVAPSP